MQYVFLNMSNIEDWERGVVNRNFFIVEEILRHPETEKVLLIDFLAIQSKKRLFGKMRTLRYAAKMLARDSGKLVSWSHKLVPAGSFFSDIRVQPEAFVGTGFLRPAKSTLKLVDKLISEQGFDREKLVLWSYNPFVPDFLSIKAKLRVFDAVDDWSQHPRYRKDRELLVSNYQQVDKQADIIFTVSENLSGRFSNESCYWIANGVDTVRIQPSFETHHRPIVGYVGTIEERIDFDLLAKLIEMNPDKDFVFYGPIWDSVKKNVKDLKARFSNTAFPGRIDFRDLSDLLASFDVGIVPHRLNGLSASMNPMKIYDYLAAGKPVVSTVSTGIDHVDSQVNIVHDAKAFSAQIQKVLAENTPEKSLERVELAQHHSWKARVAMMLAHIKKKW